MQNVYSFILRFEPLENAQKTPKNRGLKRKIRLEKADFCRISFS
jgi:hypothetical protein